MHIHRSTVAQVWRSEDSQWELVLSFHHEDSGGRTQVVRFGEKCQCLLSHLTSQLPSSLPFVGSYVVWAGLKLGKQQQITSHVVLLHACSQVLGIEPRASCTPIYVHFCGCNIFPVVGMVVRKQLQSCQNLPEATSQDLPGSVRLR